MPHEPFDQDDLPLINRILDQHPEVAEVIQVVRQVCQRARFPIRTFDELAEALGGADSVVTLRGRLMRVGDLRLGLPAYYFPISSEADLSGKVSDLHARAGEPLPAAAPQGQAMGEQIPVPEGLHPPTTPRPPRPPQPGGVGIRRDKQPD
jgi:hypothetical protein